MERINQRGINLLELLIVIAIITILAVLAIPTFTKTIETAKDKEAWINLRLILAGEKMYRLENPNYYPSPGLPAESDIDKINDNLKLKLNPEVTWDYSVGPFGTDDFEAKADRLSPPTGYSGTWKLHKDGVITKEGSRPSPNPNSHTSVTSLSLRN
jgi:prepilin-type N-terminal cleavage/methylation domain-containing protein